MRRQRLAMFGFVLVLAVGGYFTWRVLYYYQQIEQGGLLRSDLSFTNRLTTNDYSNAVRALPPSEVDVDTEDDPSLGNPDAELVIVEFADFGCPFSREVSHAARRLVSLYPDRVRYVYRDFPLTDIHPEAQLAAEAGECASEQDVFWAFHDQLYQNQHDLSFESLVRYATQVGADQQQFTTCLSSGKYAEEVQEDYEDGVRAGVYGTPTFFFNGGRVEGAIPEDIFAGLIDAFLEQPEGV